MELAGGGAGRSVPLVGRLLDLVGALLFAAGGALYGWAWLGFRSVRAYQPALADGAWAAVRMADGYGRLQTIGTWLMVAGLTVFVGAWWTAGRARHQLGKPRRDSGRVDSAGP